MAECAEITLDLPDLECGVNPHTWATEVYAEMQTAFDAVIACIQNTPATWCDVCEMKADLIDCPIDASTMIDFSEAVYGEAGIGILPAPYDGLEHKYGKAITANPISKEDGWENAMVDVTFPAAFDTECLFVDVQITSCHTVVTTPTPGPNNSRIFHPIIQEELIAASGFRVWFKSDDDSTFPIPGPGLETKVYITFRWLAVGH